MINDIEMYRLEKAGVNFEIVMERFSNNTNVYLNFVKKFSKDKTYTLFLEYLQIGDIKNATSQIHNIKGIAANLGFKNLYNICDKILYNLHEKEMYELDELLEQLKKDYDDVITLINK